MRRQPANAIPTPTTSYASTLPAAKRRTWAALTTLLFAFVIWNIAFTHFVFAAVLLTVATVSALRLTYRVPLSQRQP